MLQTYAIFAAVGAGLGAVAGISCGVVADKMGGGKKHQHVRHRTFGLSTYCLNGSIPVFGPLAELHQKYVYDPQEKKAFEAAVKHLDNMLKMELMMQDPKTERKTSLPGQAMQARHLALQQLKNLLEFSDERLKSKTKSLAIQKIIEQIKTHSRNTVENMNKILARVDLP